MMALWLGIETSCDETSVALVRDGKDILSNLVSSQVDTHSRFGGVVPELACRKHLEALNPLMAEALREADAKWSDLDGVAVSSAPGLVGALLVGVAAAKAIAACLDIPLVGVNHLEGHIYANILEHPEISFPFLCLLVSGGHTNIVLVRGPGLYDTLGRTRDDAAGEAFDKVARALKIGYPGGPVIDRLARGNSAPEVSFPRAFLESGSLDFSFSGLKTSVIHYLEKHSPTEEMLPAICAGFQRAVVDVLVEKTMMAAESCGVRTIALAGGVASNSLLRESLRKEAVAGGFEFILPSPGLCTDNAAMIAAAGFHLHAAGRRSSLSLDARPNGPLEELAALHHTDHTEMKP
jgi:N6-L-threonylcarbamoyladenine synthase